jgi:hypothetical protein
VRLGLGEVERRLPDHLVRGTADSLVHLRRLTRSSTQSSNISTRPTCAVVRVSCACAYLENLHSDDAAIAHTSAAIIALVIVKIVIVLVRKIIELDNNNEVVPAHLLLSRMAMRP